MAVYIINNMTIHDRAAYDRYVSGFMPVFSRYRGEILAISDKPPAVEGEWPYDRTVLLRFPDRAEVKRWLESPEYQAIVKDRYRGTKSNVVFLDSFEFPKR